MEKNTVIILGAGASYDYGYPTGLELTNLINATVEWSYLLSEIDASSESDEDDVNIRDGLRLIDEHFFKSRSLSIDRWLAKKENSKCTEAAKLLIALFISRHERQEFSQNDFFKVFKQKNNEGYTRKDWYQLLFNAMETDDFNAFPNSGDRLTIITFNYDRSLEFYLHNKLRHTYINRDEKDYLEKLKKVRIIHVYGSVGLYDPSDSSHVHYLAGDKKKSVRELGERAARLKLIREPNENNSQGNQFHEYLENAQQIFFIGFSYDELNLKALGFPIKSQHSRVTLLGTTLGMEKGEIAIAKRRTEIHNSKQELVQLKEHDMNAYTFFRSEVIQAFYI